MNKSALLLALGLAVPGIAWGATLQQTFQWSGLRITATYPDKVTFNTSFAVSFDIDSSPLANTGADPVSFLTSVGISNTVNLANAGWTYRMFSSDPGFRQRASGSVGDAYAPLEATTTGYEVAFYDRYDPWGWGYTWLWPQYDDRVQWTLQKMVIRDHTDFTLRLGDDITGAAELDAQIRVLDPPAQAAVPAPSSLALALAGLGLLGLRRRARFASPAA